MRVEVDTSHSLAYRLVTAWRLSLMVDGCDVSGQEGVGKEGDVIVADIGILRRICTMFYVAGSRALDKNRSDEVMCL